MKKNIFFLGILMALIFLAAGCRSSLVVKDRPVAPRYERPLSPGPRHVWVSGEWVKRGGTYVYRNGYWAPQRRGHMYYVAGHWQDKRQGWTWIPGHWR